MNPDDKVIHGLWIGKTLSPIELLCLKSFIFHGHEFHLWVYDHIETPLPAGVIVEDASKVIGRDNVFSYRNTNQFGHGKGSYAGFSDIFRYKLLYEYGGWWVDMDVICLKPFDFDEDFVFRKHHDFPMVGNMMKCKKNSDLMRICYEKASAAMDEHNRDWNLPIKILNDAVEDLQMKQYIREISNPDSWLYVRKLLLKKCVVPGQWYALHLINEEWNRNKIDRMAMLKNSVLGDLLQQYSLWESSPLSRRWANMFRLIMVRVSVKQMAGLVQRIFWKIVRMIKKEKPR